MASEKTTAPEPTPRLSAQAEMHKHVQENPTPSLTKEELVKLTYHELDILWGKKRAESLLATGTERFGEIHHEMQEIKEIMELKNKEFGTPDRLANAQKIGVQ